MTFKRFGGLSRRIYLAFLLAAAIPTAIAGIIGVYYSLEILKSETLHNLGQEVGVRAQGIGRFFSQLSAELLYLSGSRPLGELRESLTAGEPGRIDHSRERLEQDFANFVALYPHVYQLRYLGPEGKEIVRVDRRGERVHIVPRDQLQDKSDRYYFREAIRSRPGEIYVSPLDLNIEFGQVEKPERPVIRVATPVAASGGLLIVNLHADILLEQVQQMADTRNGVAYLFDRSGHFLVRSADKDPDLFFDNLMKEGHILTTEGYFTSVAVVSDEIREGVAMASFNFPGAPANAVVHAVPDPVTNNYRYKLGRGTLTKVGESPFKHNFTAMSFKPRPIA